MRGFAMVLSRFRWDRDAFSPGVSQCQHAIHDSSFDAGKLNAAEQVAECRDDHFHPHVAVGD